MRLSIIPFAILLLFSACKNNNKSNYQDVKINTEALPSKVTDQSSQALHTVMVNEIIPTDDYVYLNVTEGSHKFWIATKKADAKIGETYFYLGGLLKNNFESKSLNRVFDELYLVGNLVSSNHGSQISHENGESSQLGEQVAQEDKNSSQNTKIIPQKGSIKISEIVTNPKKYEGQTVQIDAKCTKVNNGIMDRNWIHLKDGSKDDFDLVVTSDAFVKVGSVVTMKANVVLNKDFGAGYKYDVILENGILIKEH